MKLKHGLFSLILGLVCGVVGAAGGPLDLSTGSTGFASTPPPGGFAELFTFTLTVPSVASASITSAVSGLQDVDFTAVYLTGPSGVFTFSQVLSDPFETWALLTGVLSPGAYALTVVGTNSAAAGSYGGSLAVAAIPEPETVALLLGGMAAMASLIWRRTT